MAETQIKSDKSNDNKITPEEQKKRRRTCCIAIFVVVLFLLFLVIGVSLIMGSFFGSPSSKYIPTRTPSNTSSPQTATKTYPTPESCSQVNIPNSATPSVSPENPGLKDNVQYHTYQIFGYSENDLRLQMNQCGPKMDGEPYDAMTTYTMNWSWNLLPSYTDCRVIDPVVGINVDIYIPNWNAPSDVQAGLTSKWLTFVDRLTYHENNHMQIEVDGARDMLSALQSQPAYATCDEANNSASAVANDFFNRTNNATTELDDTTNHGQTQGTVFP